MRSSVRFSFNEETILSLQLSVLPAKIAKNENICYSKGAEMMKDLMKPVKMEEYFIYNPPPTVF